MAILTIVYILVPCLLSRSYRRISKYPVPKIDPYSQYEVVSNYSRQLAEGPIYEEQQLNISSDFHYQQPLIQRHDTSYYYVGTAINDWNY